MFGGALPCFAKYTREIAPNNHKAGVDGGMLYRSNLSWPLKADLAASVLHLEVVDRSALLTSVSATFRTQRSNSHAGIESFLR
jgi:hypothetical protein